MVHSRTSRITSAALSAVLSVSMVLAPQLASAQPAPGPTTTGTGSGSSAALGVNSPAPGEDAKLYSCQKRTKDITLTLKPETELKELITWVMSFTCKNFIFDPRFVSTGKKITVISPNTMSAPEAYRLFLVALSTMGLTVVPKGNALRIVESASAKSEALPIYKGGVPGDEDQMVRYVLKPSYAQVEVIHAALETMKSAAGTVTVAGNMLILTDYASQIRDMLTLSRSMDVPGNNENIYTIAVLHADATQLAQKLNEILGITATPAAGAKPGTPPAAGGGRPNTAPVGPPGMASTSEEVANATPSKILVDDRTNTLIVVSSEAGYLRVKSLVQRLDIVLDTEGGQSVHVYSLQNALAEEVATTLNNALGGAGAKPGTTPAGTAGAKPGAPAPPPPTPGATDNNLGAALEGQVRVIGDKATNSLVVMSNARDYISLKEVIKLLDHPRRQVYIEAVILEVNLSKDVEIGTAAHGGLPEGTGSLIIGGVENSTLNSLNAASSLASATGLIGGIIGSPLTNSTQFLGTSIPSYALLFQALSNQANTDILSEPHIIAIDNEKAEFSVGNNIPYKAGLSFGGLPTSTTAGATGATSPVGSIGQNIQREDLNLVLNVTPHISSDDAVRLELEHETKDQGATDPDLGPTWTQRKLKTQVVVHDQQSVVIGGLISEREVYHVSKVPLLGDIPLVGYLFKYSSKSKVRSNLLILLTPYIIKDQLDLQTIRERKERERQEFVKSFDSLNESKYEPKVDYRRKRGLVEDINRAITAVEEDRNVLNSLGSRHHPVNGPLDYTPAGSSIDSPEQVDERTLGPGPRPQPLTPVMPNPRGGGN